MNLSTSVTQCGVTVEHLSGFSFFFSPTTLSAQHGHSGVVQLKLYAPEQRKAVEQCKKWHVILILHASSAAFLLICPSNSRNPKIIQFKVIRNGELQQIATFQRMEPANIWHYSLINVLKRTLNCWQSFFY